MSEENADSAEAGVLDMFDTSTGESPVCRVCGSLVAASDEYRRAHWAWHEAPNGA